MGKAKTNNIGMEYRECVCCGDYRWFWPAQAVCVFCEKLSQAEMAKVIAKRIERGESKP